MWSRRVLVTLAVSAVVNKQAGVLLDYPVVADAVAEAYKEYAKTPLETRCLYFSLSRKEVA
jgi:hypothetical protein